MKRQAMAENRIGVYLQRSYFERLKDSSNEIERFVNAHQHEYDRIDYRLRSPDLVPGVKRRKHWHLSRWLMIMVKESESDGPNRDEQYYRTIIDHFIHDTATDHMIIDSGWALVYDMEWGLDDESDDDLNLE